MIGKETFTYYDLRRRAASPSIELLFPDWQGASEKIAILCPHDDDGILGAGHAILAALANGAQVYIMIYCDGRAGYSTPEDKATIVQVRGQETVACYRGLGLPAEHIIRFDFPDFSIAPNISWLLPWSDREGTIGLNLRTLRRLQPTRLLIPNGYREHIDHESTFRAGAYDGPQVGDNILADWGLAPAVKSVMIYPVWGDLSPEDALVTGSDVTLRGNRAILAGPEVEETIFQGIREFRSQTRVIEGLVEARKGRRHGAQTIEVYQAFDPRPAFNYGPYHTAIEAIDRRGT